MNSKESFIVEFVANLQWLSLLSSHYSLSMYDEFWILLILVFSIPFPIPFRIRAKKLFVISHNVSIIPMEGKNLVTIHPLCSPLFQLIEISTIFVHFNYPWQSILIKLRNGESSSLFFDVYLLIIIWIFSVFELERRRESEISPQVDLTRRIGSQYFGCH